MIAPPITPGKKKFKVINMKKHGVYIYIYIYIYRRTTSLEELKKKKKHVWKLYFNSKKPELIARRNKQGFLNIVWKKKIQMNSSPFLVKINFKHIRLIIVPSI